MRPLLLQIDNTKVAGEKLADEVIGFIMDESIEANEEELPELFRRMARIHEIGRDLEIIKPMKPWPSASV